MLVILGSVPLVPEGPARTIGGSVTPLRWTGWAPGNDNGPLGIRGVCGMASPNSIEPMHGLGDMRF
jgi:hypothetical protein